MAKQKITLENPITGISIPCSGIKNKTLLGASVSGITFSPSGNGGKISIEYKFNKMKIIRENDVLPKDVVFLQITDGVVRGEPEGLQFELKNLVKDELRPAETNIVFKFGASKVGPGSGKVGPGSGTSLKKLKSK